MYRKACFARNCGGKKFKWPDKEVLSLIEYDQIERRLDSPITMGEKHHFQFVIDFQVYVIN